MPRYRAILANQGFIIYDEQTHAPANTHVYHARYRAEWAADELNEADRLAAKDTAPAVAVTKDGPAYLLPGFTIPDEPSGQRRLM